MKGKHSPAPAPLDLPDTTYFNRPEAERAAASYRNYFLSEEERIAVNEKNGYPTAPYKPNRTGYAEKRKGGKTSE